MKTVENDHNAFENRFFVARDFNSAPCCGINACVIRHLLIRQNGLKLLKSLIKDKVYK